MMKMYKLKLLSKEDLAQTLRACQASQNEMKSKDRDDACAFIREIKEMEGHTNNN